MSVKNGIMRARSKGNVFDFEALEMRANRSVVLLCPAGLLFDLFLGAMLMQVSLNDMMLMYDFVRMMWWYYLWTGCPLWCFNQHFYIINNTFRFIFLNPARKKNIQHQAFVRG